jgi:hypothetical protein
LRTSTRYLDFVELDKHPSWKYTQKMKRPRIIVHLKDNQDHADPGVHIACTVKPHILHTIHRNQARSVVAMLVVAVTKTSPEVVTQISL